MFPVLCFKDELTDVCSFSRLLILFTEGNVIKVKVFLTAEPRNVIAW